MVGKVYYDNQGDDVLSYLEQVLKTVEKKRDQEPFDLVIVSHVSRGFSINPPQVVFVSEGRSRVSIVLPMTITKRFLPSIRTYDFI